MDIYIKPVKKASISERKLVYLKDIAEVYTAEGKQSAIENTIVLRITEDNRATYLISVMDVIKTLSNAFPNFTINNVGEMDTIVEYSPVIKKEKSWFVFIKVAAIFFVLFAGASTAIMSFHSDGEIPQILKNYYFIFFREYINLPFILVIPYSFGLAFGIIIFFNHFSKMYVTKDPTPLEVEMTTYENETIASIVDSLNKNKKGSDGRK